MSDKKTGLIILDGWGIGDKSESDAIYHAQTPCMDQLMEEYPNATLVTYGEQVGLPEGQMGNSEVGHLNIGAGRIVYQELTRINKSIKDKDFFENKVLLNAFEKAKTNKVKVHLIGLVSKGGVHSSQEHLYALCDMAKAQGVTDVNIHAFTDGRDCDPKSGKTFLAELNAHLENSVGKVASVIGRYYAMDRDNRWERVEKAYDLLVKGEGKVYQSVEEVFTSSYAEDITDEFIEPAIIAGNEAKIAEGDVVICFNFRTDRPREISIALTQKDFPENDMKALKLEYLTMTSYDDTFKNVNVIFEKDNLVNTLGEVLEGAGKSQVRIAETEKYPHVTFFFSGGRESEFDKETRILVNSPKVATYDLQPDMSAPEVKAKIINELNTNQPDFFCLNFANPDMVGHTGDYKAIQKAVETVDGALCEILETGMSLGYEFIVIADHGNADYAINADGTPNTAHSTNPVPVIYVGDKSKHIKDGKLADVAPTILHLLGVEKSAEMTGESLL
ncbi:2,3-bisphosphoglycerate-independent phosphoglycerate mutase [Lishizhenia sp.]|uniref:2,3-bisphosphoglycerate-independent phosphoglycerate mutase n=1 Tax=Lishizhenia sp. TaxID=2497594 RepID=UPI00299D7AAC|nr:2,3-bisphosphoglycerate-independent phosphoglycerate mutase [Lishizhenia sp.]MDX1444979.1 2,3-bisphosphoglycerate-independent phosphoglycerate mutase [Lishizhenia sp.]